MASFSVEDPSPPTLIKVAKPIQNVCQPTFWMKMSPNICPYIGLEIPLRGDSNFTVMFLRLPPVISTLGIPQGNTFFWRRDDGPHFARKPSIWEPSKSTKAGAQLYSHSLTQATLNRYSRIYDAGGLWWLAIASRVPVNQVCATRSVLFFKVGLECHQIT